MSSNDLERHGDAGRDERFDELGYWRDRRLVETYARLSRDLRDQGFDARTVHRMGRVEEELRDRDLDPDRIARAVDERRGGRGRP